MTSKIVDSNAVIKLLCKFLKREIFMREKSIKEIAKKINTSESQLSWILWARPTSNKEVYRKIAHAIGLTDTQFENMIQEAQQEAFGGGKPSLDYALSSELGDNPDAQKDVLNFVDFVKQKYGIKK